MNKKKLGIVGALGFAAALGGVALHRGSDPGHEQDKSADTSTMPDTAPSITRHSRNALRLALDGGRLSPLISQLYAGIKGLERFGFTDQVKTLFRQLIPPEDQDAIIQELLKRGENGDYDALTILESLGTEFGLSKELWAKTFAALRIRDAIRQIRMEPAGASDEDAIRALYSSFVAACDETFGHHEDYFDDPQFWGMMGGETKQSLKDLAVEAYHANQDAFGTWMLERFGLSSRDALNIGL